MFSLQLTRAHYSSSCNRLLIYWFSISQSCTNGVPIKLHSMISHVKWIPCASVSDFIAVFVSMKMNKEESTKTDHPLFGYTTRTNTLALCRTYMEHRLSCPFSTKKKTLFRHKQWLIFEWFGCHIHCHGTPCKALRSITFFVIYWFWNSCSLSSGNLSI